MPPRSSRFLVLGVIAAGLGTRVPPAGACSTPVFEYALIYWAPDPYEIIVFHRGPLTPEEQAVVDRLRRGASSETRPGNWRVRTADLETGQDTEPRAQATGQNARAADVEAEQEESIRALWHAQISPAVPWMVACFPGLPAPERAFWSGRLSAAAAEALVDSPLRREIGRRLMRGEAAVWVMLESGHAQADNAAAELLRARLKQAADDLKRLGQAPASPAASANGGADRDVEIEIVFSLLRVSRADPNEQVLVQMLLRSEADLGALRGTMAFPVFGRGRVLYALVGAGINEDNIREACAFLVAGCACQTKWEAPGVDLLMMADWEAAFARRPPEDPLPLAGLSGLIAEMAAESAPARTPPPPPSGPAATRPAAAIAVNVGTSSQPVLRNALIAAALGLAGTAGLALLLGARRRWSRRHG